MTNVFFQFFSFFDIILLTIVYFSKKIFKTEENKIYSRLIIASIMGQILHILSYITIYNMNKIPTINYIVIKLYLVYLAIWASLLFLYICAITYKYSKDKGYSKKIKKTKLYIFLLDIIVIFLIFILPTYCYVEPTIVYTYGSSIMLIYIVSIAYICLCVLLFIRYIKEIVKGGLKKYIPLFVFILIGSIVMIIQFINPGLLLMTACETFITFLMYFTIENPDLQMLREFHKVREIAEESNKGKTAFLFDISNQIKNPINSINVLSKEIMMEEDINIIKSNINEVIKNSTELLQTVNNVLDITDLENRKIEIRDNKYQPANLFKSVNKVLETKIDSKKVKYRFHFDKSIPEYLYGDSIRLKQIMNIVLDNASEYTKEGFIEVNVHSVLKHDICRLIITVEDSGIGMTSEEMEHLFDKNKIYSDEQLKKIDDTKNNLGIVKSLVNLMGGSIMVNSEYGKGSKFTIVIDQKIQEAEKTKTIEAVEKYEEVYVNNQKILLVINDNNLSKKLNKIFKFTEYEIEEVTGGQACLEKLRNKEKFDIILIEEHLEKLSSENTLVKIKDTPGYKIPVLLLTDNNEFGAKEMYQEKGFKDTILLPVKKEELLKSINKYIED